MKAVLPHWTGSVTVQQQCGRPQAVLLQSTGSAAVLGCSPAAFQRHATLQRQWHQCLKAVLPHCEGAAAAMCRHCCLQLQAVLPHWEGSVTVQQQCCCRIVKARPLPCEGSAASLDRQCHCPTTELRPSTGSVAAVHWQRCSVGMQCCSIPKACSIAEAVAPLIEGSAATL